MKLDGNKTLYSPFQAPHKHLPSNKSLRKNKTKTTTRTTTRTKQARKHKTSL
ncbi:DNA replication protein DnaD [Bacillus toyonensis]|nr:DNA replication protein DnaD [Bacillus toyonensis]PHD56094.1 DNA replication protein DnaD [Bacillus toyonensis]